MRAVLRHWLGAMLLPILVVVFNPVPMACASPRVHPPTDDFVGSLNAPVARGPGRYRDHRPSFVNPAKEPAAKYPDPVFAGSSVNAGVFLPRQSRVLTLVPGASGDALSAMRIFSSLGSAKEPFSKIIFGLDPRDQIYLYGDIHSDRMVVGGQLYWFAGSDRDPSLARVAAGEHDHGQLFIDGDVTIAGTPKDDREGALQNLEFVGGSSMIADDLSAGTIGVGPSAALRLHGRDTRIRPLRGIFDNRGLIIFDGAMVRSGKHPTQVHNRGIMYLYRDTDFSDRDMSIRSHPGAWVHLYRNQRLSMASDALDAFINKGFMRLGSGSVLDANLFQDHDDAVLSIAAGNPVVIRDKQVTMRKGILALEIIDAENHARISGVGDGHIRLDDAWLRIDGTPEPNVFRRVFSQDLLRDKAGMPLSDNDLLGIPIFAPYSPLYFALAKGGDGAIDLYAVPITKDLRIPAYFPRPFAEPGYLRWRDTQAGSYGVFVSIPDLC